MSSLATEDKKRARWHLGYNESVPAPDRSILEDRMNKVQDNYTVSKIVGWLDRCDRGEVETETDQQDASLRSKRTLLGDVNRTDVEYGIEPLEKRLKSYRRDCDRLAAALGVVNWNKPEMDQYREYFDTNRTVTVPAPTDVTYNLTYGSDLYYYYA